VDQGEFAVLVFGIRNQRAGEARERHPRSVRRASDGPGAAAADESESGSDVSKRVRRCTSKRRGPQTTAAKIRFEPQSLSLKAGQTATIGVVVENVNDLFSIPLLLQYNPAVISVEEVQHGGFLSGGTQEIAIVQRVDKEHGQAIISATRQPNTPGVNGSGTLIGIVIKALAPGSSNLSIVQVNAKDSQQKLIPLVTSEATLQSAVGEWIVYVAQPSNERFHLRGAAAPTRA